MRLSNMLLRQGYVKERLKSSLRKVLWSVRGSYQTIGGPPLSNVTLHSGGWPYTMASSIDEILHQFLTLYWSRPYYRIWLFYLIVWGFHRTFATDAACQQRTLTPLDTWSCPIWDLQMFFCWDHWHSIIHYTSLLHLSLTWLFTEFDVITEYRFPYGICNGCGMPTGDAYSSGHLVLSHFGTCICSNVETNLFLNLSCFQTFWVSKSLSTSVLLGLYVYSPFIVLIAFIEKTVYNGHCWSLNKDFLLWITM